MDEWLALCDRQNCRCTTNMIDSFTVGADDALQRYLLCHGQGS